MSEEEKKKEKKKKVKESSSVFDGFMSLSNLSVRAMNAQQSLMNSAVVTAALRNKEMLENYKRMYGTFETISSLRYTAMAHQANLASLQMSLRTRTLIENQLRNYAVTFTRINQIAKPLIAPTPALTQALVAAPPKNEVLVRSLLREIEMLEKELAKEKGKNKELLALLDEKRKELKKQYVS